jgi:hypothetical protein
VQSQMGIGSGQSADGQCECGGQLQVGVHHA